MVTYEEFVLTAEVSYFNCKDSVPTELIDFLFKVCPNISVLHFERLKTLVKLKKVVTNLGSIEIPVLELQTLYNYLMEHNLL